MRGVLVTLKDQIKGFAFQTHDGIEIDCLPARATRGIHLTGTRKTGGLDQQSLSGRGIDVGERLECSAVVTIVILKVQTSGFQMYSVAWNGQVLAVQRCPHGGSF